MVSFHSFYVLCPRDILLPQRSRSRRMQLLYVVQDGQRIYAPCNGCDLADGSGTCRSCAHAIFLMASNGHIPIPAPNPVTPDFSLLPAQS